MPGFFFGRLNAQPDAPGPTACASATYSATGTSSAKLAAVRSWLDTLTLAAAANPDDARSDWPAAPHPFDEVLTEALTALTAP